MKKIQNIKDNIYIIPPSGKRKKDIIFVAHYSKTNDTIINIVSLKMAKDGLFN